MRPRPYETDRFPPDGEGYRPHHPPRYHHPSNAPSQSPSPSPPPPPHRNSHRFREHDDYYPNRPYYPPYDYPDYGRLPPPPYPPSHSSAPFHRRKKKHMYHLESEKRTKVHTIFMFNLSYQLTNENLQDICSKYGEISELIYPLSKPGMGFVTYYDIRDAEKAVTEMNGIELNGRTVHTNFAYVPPAHSKRRLEDICANVFTKIESVQNMLRTLSETKDNSNSDGHQNQSIGAENEDNAIDKEIARVVSDIGMTVESVQSVLSSYGEVRSVEDFGNGVFLAKFYDIRSARKCVEDGSNNVGGEKVIFEFAQADLGDDETNSEFSREEYYKQFGDENNESKPGTTEYSNNEEKRDDDINNDLHKPEKSRDNYHNRYRTSRDYDRPPSRDHFERKRDYESMPHYRDDHRRRREYMPPYPTDFGEVPYEADPHPPMGRYPPPPYPGPPMRSGRYRNSSRRDD